MKANHKVVVVTGASAGVGRAIVRAFAKQGASIGLIARGVDGLEGARREVESAGGKALVLPCDVSDAAKLDQCATRVEEELGPIDVWVNDAMVSVFSPVKEMLPEEYRRVTEVTYLGYVFGTLAALQRMLPRDRGVILQIGSALAYRGIPLQSAYCAAKHAIQGFCDSLRCELLHDSSNVQISMLQLPAVNTPQFGWVKSRLPHKAQPVPPIFQPELIADAAVYAADHPRREFWLGVPTVEALSANKVAPGFLDHYLARNGYDAQQFDGAEDPDRPNNLWEPVPGDHGAHGIFDKEARDWSPQIWATKHKSAALGSLAAGLGIAAALLLGSGRRFRSA